MRARRDSPLLNLVVMLSSSNSPMAILDEATPHWGLLNSAHTMEKQHIKARICKQPRLLTMVYQLPRTSPQSSRKRSRVSSKCPTHASNEFMVTTKSKTMASPNSKFVKQSRDFRLLQGMRDHARTSLRNACENVNRQGDIYEEDRRVVIEVVGDVLADLFKDDSSLSPEGRRDLVNMAIIILLKDAKPNSEKDGKIVPGDVADIAPGDGAGTARKGKRIRKIPSSKDLLALGGESIVPPIPVIQSHPAVRVPTRTMTKPRPVGFLHQKSRSELQNRPEDEKSIAARRRSTMQPRAAGLPRRLSRRDLSFGLDYGKASRTSESPSWPERRESRNWARSEEGIATVPAAIADSQRDAPVVAFPNAGVSASGEEGLGGLDGTMSEAVGSRCIVARVRAEDAADPDDERRWGRIDMDWTQGAREDEDDR